MDSPSPSAAKFRHRHLQDNRSRWLCTQQTRWKLLELLVFQWWANDGDAGLTLKQHRLNVFLSVCLALAKNYPSWTACHAFQVDREWRQNIITWLYLQRYRSRDTDTWWCRQTRGIHPILFQCWANYGDAGQHWNSIGWMPWLTALVV